MKAQPVRLALVGVLTCLLSACDYVGGNISLTVQLAKLPNREVVETALGDIPDIKHVECHGVKGAIEIHSTGTVRQPDWFKVEYRSANARGFVFVRQTSAGKNELTLTSVWINRRPSHEAVA
jgi:hypothetical protein